MLTKISQNKLHLSLNKSKLGITNSKEYISENQTQALHTKEGSKLNLLWKVKIRYYKTNEGKAT